MSHHTTFGLVVWQRPHRVAGAPELESSTSLKVLTLKVHRRASRFVQHVVAEYGGHHRIRGNARGSRADISQRRAHEIVHGRIVARARGSKIRSAGIVQRSTSRQSGGGGHQSCWTRSGFSACRAPARNQSISGIPKSRNRGAQPLAIMPVKPCVIPVPCLSEFLDGRSRVPLNRRQ